MSSVFAVVCDGANTGEGTRLDTAARAFLPFVPEGSKQWEVGEGTTALAWSVLDEGPRGSFWWEAPGNDRVVIFDGWFSEGSSPGPSASQGLARCLEREAPADLTRRLGGEWSLVEVSPRVVRCACDFAGSRHLYVAQRGSRAVVSNRAMICAALLNGGEVPRPDPFHMGWLLTLAAAPMGRGTPWRDVSLLKAGEAVTIRDGAVEILDSTPVPERVPWEDLFEEFVERCSQVRNAGGLPFRVGLTGGKDSRLVWGGLRAAGLLDELEGAYLKAREGTADVKVGRSLAEAEGVAFRLEEPGDGTSPTWEDFVERIDRHGFQSEYGLNAWDLKAVVRRRREGRLHGNLGEIFRGYTKVPHWLSWRQVRRFYSREKFVDPLGVLTEEARQGYAGFMNRWVEERRRAGTKRTQIHDEYHAHARMQRWVGQAQLIDGCGVYSMNPIPSPRLFGHFQTLSLRDRVAERVHFELMGRCGRDLVERPFAGDRWSKWLGPGAAFPRPVTSESVTGEVEGGKGVSPQLERWIRHGSAIEEYLLDDGDSSFFDLVDRRRLERFFDDMPGRPGFVELRAIYGLLGIRRALDEEIESMPFEMEKRRR